MRNETLELGGFPLVLQCFVCGLFTADFQVKFCSEKYLKINREFWYLWLFFVTYFVYVFVECEMFVLIYVKKIVFRFVWIAILAALFSMFVMRINIFFINSSGNYLFNDFSRNTLQWNLHFLKLLICRVLIVICYEVPLW